jgi:peroxiredoxin
MRRTFTGIWRTRKWLVVALIFGSGAIPRPGFAQKLRLGGAAPGFALASLEGDTVSLAGLRGHPVILKFWASWCPTCRAEMLQILTAQQLAPNLRVLTVNADEPAERIRRFLAREQLTLPFPVLMDPSARVSRTYRIPVLPTTIFLDQEGIVRRIHSGAIAPLDFAHGLSSILPSSSKE